MRDASPYGRFGPRGVHELRGDRGGDRGALPPNANVNPDPYPNPNPNPNPNPKPNPKPNPNQVGRALEGVSAASREATPEATLVRVRVRVS